MVCRAVPCRGAFDYTNPNQMMVMLHPTMMVISKAMFIHFLLIKAKPNQTKLHWTKCVCVYVCFGFFSDTMPYVKWDSLFLLFASLPQFEFNCVVALDLFRWLSLVVDFFLCHRAIYITDWPGIVHCNHELMLIWLPFKYYACYISHEAQFQSH